MSECKSLSTEYRDLDVLINLDIDVYKRKSNKVVMAFLNGISKESNEKNNAAKYCLAVKQIYSLAYPFLVASVLFVSNLVQYQTTQSRLNIDLNSKLYPCGSYPVVSKWLSTQSTVKEPFPDSDCMVAFDNDQIVEKHGLLKLIIRSMHQK